MRLIERNGESSRYRLGEVHRLDRVVAAKAR